MTSKILDLPDPFGPVIAKTPVSEKGGCSKLTSLSPSKELMFLKRMLSIFISHCFIGFY
jgi:hypothetical protein